MPRMRLVSQAYEEIKASDPGTCLTLCALRRLINSGAIPVTRSGRKKFIDMDVLTAYLSREGTAITSPGDTGGIRPVSLH